MESRIFEKVHIIVNPISGGKDKKRVGSHIQNYISRFSASSNLFFTSARKEASRLSKEALDHKVDLVVAVGGDGTINEVASELVHSNTALAIIPMGSGNGLARSLGIPLEIEQACELLSRGIVRNIDVGKVNDRLFFLIAGIGFDARVGRAFEEHNHRGPLPYFYLSAKEFFEYIPETFEVIANGKTSKISPFQLAVANGRQYGNNAYIAPDAKMNDGLLNVCIFHRLPFHRLFTQLPKIFLGDMKDLPDTEFFTTTHLKIIRNQDAVINIDGEPTNASSELEFTVIPGGLRVLTPRTSASLL